MKLHSLAFVWVELDQSLGFLLLVSVESLSSDIRATCY